jgi:hypothetical protein
MRLGMGLSWHGCGLGDGCPALPAPPHDLRAVFDVGGGCMTLTVLTAVSSVALVADAMSGEERAAPPSH